MTKVHCLEIMTLDNSHLPRLEVHGMGKGTEVPSINGHRELALGERRVAAAWCGGFQRIVERVRP